MAEAMAKAMATAEANAMAEATAKATARQSAQHDGGANASGMASGADACAGNGAVVLGAPAASLGAFSPLAAAFNTPPGSPSFNSIEDVAELPPGACCLAPASATSPGAVARHEVPQASPRDML